jgi:serine/threonine-protein kinase
MSSAQADRNLLFGILAVQMDFVSRDGLLAGMHAWVLDKAKPLGDILRDLGHLTDEHRHLLDALVAAHLRAHHEDPRESLAALSSISSVRDALRSVADPGLQASLDQTGPDMPRALQTTDYRLGDGLRYRILRPHARGGLGEVFVALDTELRREVALKEIQAAHADNPHSRGRFLLEAEVTGGLEHPGIVPVYGLGQYDDGRPFYAMRFIKGDNLKEAIERFHQADKPGRDAGERSLALRQLLRRFLDVCNAVAYAHSRGVLHRDLKPGNIMLGTYGETLLVDWGLAKIVGSAGDDAREAALRPSSGSGEVVTQMGSALGTPAYMSPEQAEGRLDLLGPASDLYSLGATLYALLTGVAPVRGDDLGEVLRKVRAGDIVPPRHVKPATPLALESICRKAMALKPGERYATALDLAADVEHWLADEPVAAYRDPWLARLARWARRHRPLVAGLGALLLAAVVFLAVLAGVLDSSRRKIAVALDAESSAVRQTRQALDAATDDVVERLLSKQVQLGSEEKAYLRKVLGFYEQFASSLGDSKEGHAARANGLVRIGLIRSRLGELAEAETAQREALALRRNLLAAYPDEPAYRNDLAKSLHNLGVLLITTGRQGEAIESLREAVAVQQALAEAFPEQPGFRVTLASFLNASGKVLQDTGHPDQAEAAHKQAVSIGRGLVAASSDEPAYLETLANALHDLAIQRILLARRKEAHDDLRESLDLRRRLAALDPAAPEPREQLSHALGNLATLESDVGLSKDAEKYYEEARLIQTGLVADFPGVPKYRRNLGVILIDYGQLLDATGHFKEAEAVYRQALDIQQVLVATFPKVPDYRDDLGNTHNSLGNLLSDHLGQMEAALTAYQEAVTLRRALATEHPDVTDYRLRLGTSLNNLGAHLGDMKRPDESEAAYREALGIQRKLVDQFPDNPEFQVELARTLANLGNRLSKAGRPQEALASYLEGVSLRRAVVNRNPDLPLARAELADNLIKLAKWQMDQRAWNESRPLLEEARPHLAAALLANPTNPEFREWERDYLQARVQWALGVGDPEAAALGAAELARSTVDPPNDTYNAACSLCSCVPLARHEVRLPPLWREVLAQVYAARAMGLLEEAVAKGYKDVENLQKDADLEPLRKRPDFARLVQALKEQPPK